MQRTQQPLGQPRARPHMVWITSVRGGSGKTTLAANLAWHAARASAKVALVDADLMAPSLHIVLGVEAKRILHTISESAKGKCDIGEVPIDLSLEFGLERRGALYFLPASTDLPTVASLLFDGYEVARLERSLRQVATDLGVDYLIVDTHLGFNRESLLGLAIADTLVVLLRPDGQDSLASAALVRTARKLGVPRCVLVPNMIQADVDQAALAESIEKALAAPVDAILPWCPELLEPKSGLFSRRQPEHPFTLQLDRLSQQIMPGPAGPADGTTPIANDAPEAAPVERGSS